MSVSLKQVLQSKGYSDSQAYALTLNTDGFSAAKNKLIGYTILPLDDVENPTTVMVAGGNAKAVEKFTNIPDNVYQLEAITPLEASKRFLELVAGRVFVITHNTKFTRGFIEPLFGLGNEAKPYMEFLETAQLGRALRAGKLTPAVMSWQRPFQVLESLDGPKDSRADSLELMMQAMAKDYEPATPANSAYSLVSECKTWNLAKLWEAQLAAVVPGIQDQDMV